LTLLARLTLWNGDFSSPALWLDEALSISRQLGDQISEEEALGTSGNLAYWQGDYQQANAFYQEAIVLSEKVGDLFQGLWARIFLAYAILRQDDVQRAREFFEDSIRRAQQAGMTIALVFAVEGLASLNVNQEQLERAARREPGMWRELAALVHRYGIIRRPALCILCRYRHKMHWSERRRFSLAEFKRFGSFPDGFAFAGPFDEGIRQIGNSVPPLFMRAIAGHIRREVLGQAA